MNNTNKAIVYRHIRLDKNEPFYIGIGNNIKRAYSKNNRNKYWRNIVNKTEYKIDILFENICWEEAKKKEIEFISLYGRKDLGLGTLCNMTNGGEGISGAIRVFSDESKKKMSEAKRKMSDETKKKMSEAHKGRKCSDETIKKMIKSRTGRKCSDETKKKISEGNIGKKHSDESKKKISETLKGKMSDETKKKIGNFFRGKKLTKEHKNKISEGLKGEKSYKFIKNYCIYQDIVYSRQEIADKLGISALRVYQIKAGKQKNHWNLIFV